MKKSFTARSLDEGADAPELRKLGMSRALFGFAALSLLASPVAAKEPRKVKIYVNCVLDSFRNPGEETSDKYDEALDLAKAQCGNLRPAATEAVKKHFGPKLARSGDDPDDAAQAFLDIMVGEQTATIWAEKHPDDVSHAR